MPALEFSIRFADGRTEQLVVDAESALVGSGAHCEIRLPPEQAAVEHLAIRLAAGGIFAEARTLDPPPTMNGSPFTQGPVFPGAVIGIGRVQIAVGVTDVVDQAKVVAKKQQKTSPMTYLLAAIAVPASLFIIFSDDEPDPVGAAPKDVPALWAAPIAQCRETAPESALALGRDKLVLADGKRERRPFHVQDGVAAVPLYETAAACLRAGGDGDDAKEADEAARTLRAQIQEDFRTHRVRLEHAISVDDWAVAHKEVRVLRAFLEGKQGEYVTWLSNLDRKLQLKYGRKG